MTPQATAPPANADILELIINHLQAALTVLTDAFASVDPLAALGPAAGACWAA